MSAQQIEMNSNTDSNKELSPREKQLKLIIDSVKPDKYVIHSETRPDKSEALKISEPGNLKWSFEVTTVPCVAAWPRLSGEGNLGSKFAQEKKQAVFEVNIGSADLFTLEDLVGPAAESLSKAHDGFFNELDAMLDAVTLTLWGHPTILKKKKQSYIELAKDSVAGQDDCDISDIADDDSRVQKMALRMFRSNANTFVNRSKDAPFIRAKAKVFKQPWNAVSYTHLTLPTTPYV